MGRERARTDRFMSLVHPDSQPMCMHAGAKTRCKIATAATGSTSPPDVKYRLAYSSSNAEDDTLALLDERDTVMVMRVQAD